MKFFHFFIFMCLPAESGSINPIYRIRIQFFPMMFFLFPLLCLGFNLTFSFFFSQLFLFFSPLFPNPCPPSVLFNTPLPRTLPLLVLILPSPTLFLIFFSSTSDVGYCDKILKPVPGPFLRLEQLPLLTVVQYKATAVKNLKLTFWQKMFLPFRNGLRGLFRGLGSSLLRILILCPTGIQESGYP